MRHIMGHLPAGFGINAGKGPDVPAHSPAWKSVRFLPLPTAGWFYRVTAQKVVYYCNFNPPASVMLCNGKSRFHENGIRGGLLTGAMAD